jgi:hypothetical protein
MSYAPIERKKSTRKAEVVPVVLEKHPDPATRFRNAASNLPWWWERMRNWTILSEDAIGLCGRIEDKEGIVIS